MSGPDAPGQELRFGTIAAAGDKLAVYLVGEVDARVDAVGGLSLSGAHAAIGTDRLLSPPASPVVLSMDGGDVRADPADVHDLRRVVVPGAGVVLRPTGFGLDDRRSTPRERRGVHEWFDTGEGAATLRGSAAGRDLPVQRAAGVRVGGPERGGSGAGPEASAEATPPRSGRASGRGPGCGAGRHALDMPARAARRHGPRTSIPAVGRPAARSADRPAACGFPGGRTRRPRSGGRTRVPPHPRIRSTAAERSAPAERAAPTPGWRPAARGRSAGSGPRPFAEPAAPDHRSAVPAVHRQVRKGRRCAAAAPAPVDAIARSGARRAGVTRTCRAGSTACDVGRPRDGEGRATGGPGASASGTRTWTPGPRPATSAGRAMGEGAPLDGSPLLARAFGEGGPFDGSQPRPSRGAAGAEGAAFDALRARHTPEENAAPLGRRPGEEAQRGTCRCGAASRAATAG
jgi:hypothetical protein